MASTLINIHVIIAEIVACILCVILVFAVFSQTIYYLCIRKLITTFCSGSKDELNLKQFEFSVDKKQTIKYDDIHPFFRITTTISMLFCFVSSISSVIAITHLLLTGTLSYDINYIRITCFVSWLFSHYSMSSVFVGRLYVSFKDSIFQYPQHIIRGLSITLALLPILLIISFLFWMFKNNDYSFIFFISFICVDVLFSIVLTWLFIQKLYQLIRGRIETKNTDKNRKKNSSFNKNRNIKHVQKSPNNFIINSDIKEEEHLDETTCIDGISTVEIQTTQSTVKLPISSYPSRGQYPSNITADITPYLGGISNVSPQIKMELPPSIATTNDCVPRLSLNINNKSSSPDIIDITPAATPIALNIPSNITTLQTVPSESVQSMTFGVAVNKITTAMTILNTADSLVDDIINKTIRNSASSVAIDINNNDNNIDNNDDDIDNKENTNDIDIDIDDLDIDTPIPSKVQTPQKDPECDDIHIINNNRLIKPKLDLDKISSNGSISTINSDNRDSPHSYTPNINGGIGIGTDIMPKTFVSLSNKTSDINMIIPNITENDKKITRERSESRAKRYISRARSISHSISTYTLSPRQSKAYQNAKKNLDFQQLELINSMTRHGLLLLLSSIASLFCVLYIMFTFRHYESMQDTASSSSVYIAYYYLYWNMGISSFLNGFSLYLSFAFAQWVYIKSCNKIHKYLEALCVIVIVKQIKRSKTNKFIKNNIKTINNSH